MTSLGTGRQTLGDRYELQEPIASGGMGQVWRGRDVLLERPVAVKVLRSEYADDPVFLERFRCEARHAAALSHPNIAAVLDYGETRDADTGESLAYLVMELVEGAPLSALLSADGPLEPGAALSVLEQTAAGLAEAHRAGLVHRDVKPANILVRPDGGVKLTDFGIAWSAESVPLTGTGQVIGTARYMSPEQAAGGRVSPASDVYALGLVGYESLTGHAPFEGTNPVAVALKQVREQPEPLPEDVPPVVRSLIGAALVKDPAERPADADAFLTAVQETIEETSGSTAVGAGPPTSPVPALLPADDDVREPPSRRRGVLLLAPVLALVLAGLLAVVLWPGGSGGGQAPAQAAESSTPSGGSAAAASSVVLTAGDHVGRPVEDVAADLTALGLTVSRETEQTTAVAPGTVAALDPVGVPLRAGDRVTLSVAAAPPAAGSPAGPAPAEDTAPAREPAPSDTAAPGSESATAPAAPSATTPPGPAPSQPADTGTAPSGAGESAPAGSAPGESAPAPEGSAPAPSDPVEPSPTEPEAPAPTAPESSEPVEPAPSEPAPSEPDAPAPTSPGSPGSSSAPSAGPSGPSSAGTPGPDTGAAG
ncbi:serine/threonine-protein kinase [Geodermatophilus nigrescens]|uniref:non-specific serine/threonine protein kinase n=1 Tax=Geodermatophilus nigrescens TaxID=1070870 RepID=A0A1M5IC15_9ACTN|nr:serine/threonine-protein kinase [Geodermatophilus nigrescens]SHG25801.1 serine/threonine protein kinase [Geodermatophilus nigrescens]